MGKFKIVFLDGQEIEIEALNFSVACVLAAYGRLKLGGRTHKALGIDEKRSKKLDSGLRRNDKGENMCGDSEYKKPRLFYYEESCDSFVPIIENEIPGIIDLDQFSQDGEVIELQIKRIDMTDKEFENLSEA